MKVSELPIDKIIVGLRVQSDSTKRFGSVTRIWREPMYLDPNDEEAWNVEIEWDSGVKSIAWPFELDKVTVLENE